ncbi:hypothetical protein EBB07_22970 [Paenibacillaceae bacterium]|nr:hypothetical protein EBB07_22970 [Paenibacillaceae bacterium]
MKRVLSFISAILLVIGFFPLPALADTDAVMSGDGSAGNPYIIMTLEQLNAVKNDLKAQYKLGADIDASETVGWNSGNGFEPIGGNGNSASQFTGIFDGAGHVISDLTINRPMTDFVGLFGIVGSGGVVRDIGLAGGSITGKIHTGGLAGRNFGTVDRSFVTGSVSSSEGIVGGMVGYGGIGSTVSASYASGAVSGPIYIGGLVGRNDGTIKDSHASGAVSGTDIVGGLAGGNEGAEIRRSYATGTVNGSGNNVGGLVGYNLSSILTQSYATGAVSGQINVGGLVGSTDFGMVSEAYATGAVNGQIHVGGLVGSNNGGQLIDSFWDQETAVQSSACGYNNEGYPGIACTATGLATMQALTQISYSGWDFTNVWFMVDGSTRPFLKSEWSQVIGNTHQLQLMALDVNADYTLAQDIDFGTVFTDGSRSDMWATSSDDGAGFAPIGSDDRTPFTGKLEGSNFTISNLTIDRPSTGYVGLFGNLGSDSLVRNVGLEGGVVRGDSSTGGLVGENRGGTIERVFAMVDVYGSFNVGGLVGQNNVGGIVRQSYAAGSITGQDFVGGLVGRNERGTVNDAFAVGAVNARYEVGGLVGRNVGDISRVYAAGRVTATGSTGGLVGRNFEPILSGAYDSQISGHSDADKGTPKMTAEMKRRATFESEWDFIHIWAIEEGRAYPTLRGVADNIGMDIAPPTVVSAVINDEYPDRVLVTFDEEVRISDTVGVTIKSNGSSETIVKVEGDGTKTLTFFISGAFEQGSVVTLSYTDQLGSIVDLAGNSMRGFADLTVYKSPTIGIVMKKADDSVYEDGSWTNQSVTVSGYAEADGSEIAALTYTLDDGAAQAYTNGTPIELSEDGTHMISFQVTDSVGNTIFDERTVKIDKTAPAVSFEPSGNETVSTSAVSKTTVSDDGSNVDASSLKYAWTKDSSTPSTGWISFVNEAVLAKSGVDGDWYLHIKASDIAGNETSAVSGRFRLTQQTENGTGPGVGYVHAPLPNNVYSIDINGRKIVFEGGQIVVPAGAMNRLFNLRIDEIGDTSVLPLSYGQQLLSNVFELTKDQAGKFERDVTISLHFNAELIRKEDVEVSLCWLNEEVGQWVALDNMKVDWEKGTVSGTSNHFSKFAVIAIPVEKEEPVIHFTDIQGHWAEKSILKMVRIDAVNGYADGSFQPDRLITRAEFATILVQALGLSDKKGKTFSDTVNHWAAQAVSTAYAYGIVAGYDDNTFAPDEFITREQMAMMIVNAMQLKSLPARKTFADQSKISTWAQKAVVTATEIGIITGYPDNTMRPLLHATRAEAVSMLLRSLEIK